MLAWSQNKAEEADWNCLGLWPISPSWHSTHPRPRWTPTPTPLALVKLSTRTKSDIAEESLQLCRMEPALIQHSTWMERGQPLLLVPETEEWELFRALTAAGTNTACAPVHTGCLLQASLAPMLLPSRANMPMLGEGRTHTWNGTSLDLTLRASPATWDPT